MPLRGTAAFAADRRHLYWRRKAPYLPSGTVLYNYPGPEALKLSGRRSRFRTEPLGPRAKGPAAPSTLTPVRACQPSGIQPPSPVTHQLTASRSDFPPQSADTPAHRHHRDPFPSGFPYWYGNRSCLRPPAQRGSPWCRTSWHRCRRRREPL